MKIDWTLVLVALVAATPPTIAALRVDAKVEKVAAQVEVVRHATNSLTDRLVITTRSDALQEGHTAGVKDAKRAAKESPNK